MPRIERIRRRHLLKKKVQREELRRIEESLGAAVNLPADARLEGGVLEDGSRVLLLDGKIYFFEHEGQMLPTLRAILEGWVSLPRVTVDMGAVRFVVNGADIMRPGVTEIDNEVREHQAVVVVDEQHNKPLAIGLSMFDAGDMQQMDSGKVIRSLHHIGDSLWEFGKD